MKIAVITPTRGMIFTEVLEYLEKERRLHPSWIQIYHSYDLPIPECLNVLVQRAMDDGAELFYFVEEDTVPPEGTLDKLIEADSDIVAMDYGQMQGQSTITKNDKGEILFTGFGCTLIKRTVFEGMEKPWFRSDKALTMPSNKWQDVNPGDAYGLHDVYFGFKARELGFKIKQIDGECRHLKLVELGDSGSNNGCHNIGEKERISKPQVINV